MQWPMGYVLSTLIILPTTTFAQPAMELSTGDLRQGIERLRADNPRATVVLDPKSGLPQSINGLESPAGIPGAIPGPVEKPAEIAIKFFDKHGAAFSLAEPRKELRVIAERPDPDFPNRRVVRVEQSIKGVPVFGARAALTVQQGSKVMSLTSSLVPRPQIVDVNTTPTIQWFEAAGRAIETYRDNLSKIKKKPSSGLTIEEQPGAITTTLQIFEPKRLNLSDEKAKLAWLVRIGTYVMFIDAHEGVLIYQYRDLQSARHRMTYDLDHQTDLGHGTLVLDENGTSAVSAPDDARIAHEHVGKAYEYFFNRFGRDSYDSGGITIQSEVRYDHDTNAYWYLGRLIYGPKFADALDIVGHEYTHAVIEHSAGLIYDGEPGALNESLADIFGAAIERWYSNNHNRNWTIGEKLPDSHMRDMSNPHNGGFDREKDFSWTDNHGQPDHYSEMVNPSHPICGSTGGDNGCVHFNSGIFNKAAYLAAAGGSHRDITVAGIGLTKVSRILYRALVTRLEPVSTFVQAKTFALDSCTELIGHNQIKSTDCENMKKAFEAVGIP